MKKIVISSYCEKVRYLIKLLRGKSNKERERERRESTLVTSLL